MKLINHAQRVNDRHREDIADCCTIEDELEEV